MPYPAHTGPATLARVERTILQLRGHNVVLDVELAARDFMFQVTPEEFVRPPMAAGAICPMCSRSTARSWPPRC